MTIHNQKGFTLIEALVAIAIFSIGFLAVATMQTNALINTTRSVKRTEAIELCSSQAETFQSLPFYPDYNDTGLGSEDRFEPHPLLADTSTDGPVVNANHPYLTIEWEIEDNEPLDELANVWLPSPPVDVTVSKTITIRVYETQTPGRILFETQITKVWEEVG